MKEILFENEVGHCLAYEINLFQDDYNFGIEEDKVIQACRDILIKEEIHNFIFIEELFIEEEFRRQGYGKELLIEFLNEHEYKTLLLYAGSPETPRRMDIIGFYEFFGFDVLLELPNSPLMLKL